MSSAGVGPLCFLKSTVNAAIYQEILEHFMLPSADKLYGDADFIFQQDLALAHTAKGTKSWFNDHGVTVLDWPANLPDLNPIDSLWGIVKRKMRDTRSNNADDLKAAIKAPWASITPQQCHRLIASMPRRIDASQTGYFICYTDHTCKDGINATWIFTRIDQHMNWFDAQSYCRHSYTDLATVRNKEDNDLIHTMFSKDTFVWIGLFQDTWQWSDQSNSSFRNWKIGQNDNVGNTCALAQVTCPGTWDMKPCDEKHPFICYDNNLILVNRTMPWNEALNYCRTYHSDLVSVHNEEIQYWVSRRAEKASTDHVWLGLRFSCYLNFWFWVSAENVCYQNWETNNTTFCGNTGAVQSKDPHYWVSLPETKELNFICSKYPSMTDPRTQYLQNCQNV
ncbi:secretory phospholipase A2 receptor-like [Paramormyrops kingsleyae]|uniref:secretory phospholipase A2 receptor-like n=1 Tax=Paramormyrops kingsleyae TaxID=1676925 RepID=UPI003B97CB87